MKRCGKCGETKPLEDFSNNKKYVDGKRTQCRVCYNEYMKQWSRRNAETVNARVLRYHHANKEQKNLERAARWQADKLKGIVRKPRNTEATNAIKLASSKKRRAILESNGGRGLTNKQLDVLRHKPCFYCQKANAGAVDHVIPIMRGGKDTEGNVVPACSSCNSQKGFKP